MHPLHFIAQSGGGLAQLALVALGGGERFPHQRFGLQMLIFEVFSKGGDHVSQVMDFQLFPLQIDGLSGGCHQRPIAALTPNVSPRILRRQPLAK